MDVLTTEEMRTVCGGVLSQGTGAGGGSSEHEFGTSVLEANNPLQGKKVAHVLCKATVATAAASALVATRGKGIRRITAISAVLNEMCP